MSDTNEKKDDINYIKNPLPLPKKNPHKVMDYDFDIPENDLKYDYEVKDGEDFDIQ